MPETINHDDSMALPPPRNRLRVSRRAMGAGALIAVLVAGAALGAGGTRMAQLWQPQRVMLLQAAPIGQMKGATTVAIKGDVVEIYGNQFILQDSSGRALIDTGPRGESRMVAEKGETLTVQGRFDRGIVRADLIAHADGRNEAFGPPGPKAPKDGPKGPKGKDGPRADRDGTPPPPPPPVDRLLNDSDAPQPAPAR